MATCCQARRGRSGEHSLEKNMVGLYQFAAHLESNWGALLCNAKN